MQILLFALSLVAFAEEQPKTTPPAPDPSPVVQLKASPGQRFSVILDGSPIGVVGPGTPMVLSDLAPGRHTAEFRTEDNLIIWARGILELKPTEELILTLSEGRPVMATGRTGAWRPATTTTTLPRKPVKQPAREAP